MVNTKLYLFLYNKNDKIVIKQNNITLTVISKK